MSKTGFLIPLISAAAALVGVILGGWWSDRREREKRHADFIGRQLAEFYGPLVSLRAEILARSVLREKVSAAGEAAWQELIAEARQVGGRLNALASVEEMQRVRKERWPSFEALIKDESHILRNELMPAYRQMITTIREKMWLATPETRDRFASGEFSALFDHIEILERHLRSPLPSEVVIAIDHREEKVKPLYTHLEETYHQLRRKHESLVKMPPSQLYRGLFRLWIALSTLWIVGLGGLFVFQFYGYFGGNIFDRYDDGYFLTRLTITFLPPLVLLGSGAVIPWIVRGFRGN